jgi:D-glycero-D-manno-heptose 1,7-bisphosphate phosphatase
MPEQPTRTTSTRTAIFLDLDGVLIETRPGRYGPEYLLRPGVEEGLQRLRELADRIVVLVEPLPARPGRRRPRRDPRLERLQADLGPDATDLTIVQCPHGADAECHCAKPEPGLIELTIERLDLPVRGGWHVGNDQAGVQAGRAAGLRTIRIGPLGEDHLSAVHRPDHEARDLLDAANWILVETSQSLSV